MVKEITSQITLSPLQQFESRHTLSEDFEMPGRGLQTGLTAVTASNYASSFDLDESTLL